MVGMAEAAKLQDGKRDWGPRCWTRRGKVSRPTTIPPSEVLSFGGKPWKSPPPGRFSGPYRFICPTISPSFALSSWRCGSFRGEDPLQEGPFQDAYHKLLVGPKSLLLLHKAQLFLPECLFLGGGLGHPSLGVFSELPHAFLAQKRWRYIQGNPPPPPGTGFRGRVPSRQRIDRGIGKALRLPLPARSPQKDQRERPGAPRALLNSRRRASRGSAASGRRP